jgi:hypothetical protein
VVKTTMVLLAFERRDAAIAAACRPTLVAAAKGPLHRNRFAPPMTDKRARLGEEKGQGSRHGQCSMEATILVGRSDLQE